VNWLTKLGMWIAVKSTPSNPSKWMLELFGGESAAGVRVGPESSQASSAVFACVQVRSQDIAKLPLLLYRKRADGKGRDRATAHSLYNLLSAKPNSFQTSFEWREMMQAHLDLRGNAYSLIKRDGRNTPRELVPLHPDWVRVLLGGDGEVFYAVRMNGQGEEKRYSALDVLHLRDRSDDGYLGKSCISRAKDVVGLDLAQSNHAAKLYANGARPGGILKHPGKIGKEGRKSIEEEFQEKFSGDNQFKVMVAGEGIEYTQVGMTNVDAEFINGRKLSRSEIAAIFRVPAHKIGILDNATFSNIEHQSLEYVTDTLMPIARRWEMALNAALLRDAEQGEYYFEFLFDALLRGDFATRMAGYATGRQWGWFSADDVREKENMNPLPDGQGQEYLRPSNMTLAGSPIPDPTKVPTTPGKSVDDIPHGDARVIRLGAT
jgi:HK97 family phage portal protein